MPKREEVEDVLLLIGMLISVGFSAYLLYELSYLIFPEGTLGP